MRYKNFSDNDLVIMYHEGDEKAFAEILKRYKSRVFGKINMFVKDRKAAEDIFQDTFIRVIHALKEGNYNEEGKFSAWLFRIAHNLCIDFIRNGKKMPVQRAREDYDPLDFVASDLNNAEEAGIRRENIRDIRKYISKLPAEQREIVHMRLYHDMSFKEIADMLNISINTALGRMRYAILNMRKMNDGALVLVTK